MIQPTHLSCVPRFYEKLLTAVASPDPKVTAAKLKAIFGPNIRFLGSGGAPLPLPIEQTLRAAGLPILPGYGLTESSPVITFNQISRNKVGTVGPALPGVDVKISPEGEILTRGPHVMKGYWKKPAETAEAIRDGWLHTGDLGTLDADGFSRSPGVKELMVLSNGKKVVPTQVEGLLVADPCIDQAIVYGEVRTSDCAVGPSVGSHSQGSRGGHPSRATDVELSKNPAVLEFSQTRRCLSRRPRRLREGTEVHRLAGAFSVAADELTVSLKMRAM